MIGVVLAAGMGSRLLPLTQGIPKTLVPLGNGQTILDTILASLAAAGLGEVVIVVGHAAAAVEEALPAMKGRYELDITLVHNDRPKWNNAYSLWLARHLFPSGVLLVNGDTMHPPAVEESLLAHGSGELLITVDFRRELTAEAMKVRLDHDGRVARITKEMPVWSASGEYIGTSLIPPEVATGLAIALEATWRADPGSFYEGAYQLYADRGGWIEPVDPGPIEWVEVDDHADLARARELACRA
jgi:choline kinase